MLTVGFEQFEHLLSGPTSCNGIPQFSHCELAGSKLISFFILAELGARVRANVSNHSKSFEANRPDALAINLEELKS
jgi:hypothetical protein